MEKGDRRIDIHESMIIFTGKTRKYLTIFQLSLNPFYLLSHGTLFPLFPRKMFSSSSILSAAQQLLATLPTFDSRIIICVLCYAEKPPTARAALQRDLCQVAHSEFDAESAAHMEDANQLSHTYEEDSASPRYHVDSSAHTPR